MSKAVQFKPEITAFLQNIFKIFTDPATKRRVLIRAILELKDRAAAYPVEGVWNRAPGTRGDNRWYQRQFGARWKRRDGSLGGTNNSQKLQKSWKTEIYEGQDFSASAFTEVTYAPFLLDTEQRVRWAGLHGWETVDEITEDYAERFEKIVLDEIDRGIDTA